MALIIQLTGLSGAGKTTIAKGAAGLLLKKGYKVLVIDGDEFRQKYSRDLNFSYSDRLENVNRIADFILKEAKKFDVVIIAIINPYHETRIILKNKCNAILVYVYCDIKTLINRDNKKLYNRALLPKEDKNAISNLSGINDRFDRPDVEIEQINTGILSAASAIKTFKKIILKHYKNDYI